MLILRASKLMSHPESSMTGGNFDDRRLGTDKKVMGDIVENISIPKNLSGWWFQPV